MQVFPIPLAHATLDRGHLRLVLLQHGHDEAGVKSGRRTRHLDQSSTEHLVADHGGQPHAISLAPGALGIQQFQGGQADAVVHAADPACREGNAGSAAEILHGAASGELVRFEKHRHHPRRAEHLVESRKLPCGIHRPPMSRRKDFETAFTLLDSFLEHTLQPALPRPQIDDHFGLVPALPQEVRHFGEIVLRRTPETLARKDHGFTAFPGPLHALMERRAETLSKLRDLARCPAHLLMEVEFGRPVGETRHQHVVAVDLTETHIAKAGCAKPEMERLLDRRTASLRHANMKHAAKRHRGSGPQPPRMNVNALPIAPGTRVPQRLGRVPEMAVRCAKRAAGTGNAARNLVPSGVERVDYRH